tara:strand:- start:30 stop:860 length:831 start_codon:yes stop_codon:yes gene_type:complete
MNKRRNILKKILQPTLKRNNQYFGFIEFISFGEVSGWAYSKESNISFIGLFIGNELVTFSPFNVVREDIKEKFKINYPTGFRILFDYKMGRGINKGLPKICALDSNKEIIFKLKPLPTIGGDKLSEIFFSPYFGCAGRFDGINQEGTLSGWASKRNYQGQLNIWLQSDKGIKPKEVVCNIWRQDLYYFKVEDCGFEINPNEITQEFNNANIWFSFDKEGKYNIDPTNKRIYFSFEGMQTLENYDSKNHNNKSDFLQEHRFLLNEFRMLLNKIEGNK